MDQREADNSQLASAVPDRPGQEHGLLANMRRPASGGCLPSETRDTKVDEQAAEAILDALERNSVAERVLG